MIIDTVSMLVLWLLLSPSYYDIYIDINWYCLIVLSVYNVYHHNIYNPTMYDNIVLLNIYVRPKPPPMAYVFNAPLL